MSSHQSITSGATNQSANDAVNGQLAQSSAVMPMSFEPKISVHCDICEENDFDTISTLDKRGWEIFDSFEFCPYHASMI